MRKTPLPEYFNSIPAAGPFQVADCTASR